MKYIKLDSNNVVLQVQTKKEKGFEEVKDSVFVVCGMIKAGSIFVNPAKDIKVEKERKKDNINTDCDNAIVSGFYSSVLGEKYFYYSTIAEQSTLNSLINLGADLEFKAQKVNVDGDGIETLGARVKYLHTNAQLIGVLADGATHIGTQVEKKDQLEALIEQATTIDEVNAIQW